MLYWQTMALCSQIHTKHIHTAVLGERRIVECYTGSTYSDHWDEKCKVCYKNHSVNVA